MNLKPQFIHIFEYIRSLLYLRRLDLSMSREISNDIHRNKIESRKIIPGLNFEVVSG